MEGLHPLLIDLALILLVAGITTVVFKKLNQPVVLGYVVAGFLTGPNFPYMLTVSDAKGVKLWSEIGVIFLMFAIGLEFSFAKLKKVGGTAAIALTFILLGMVGLGYTCGLALGWKTMDCIFLGGMLSMSSTAIIVKTFDDLNLKGQSFTDVCLGILIVEDILGIVMLVLVGTMGQTHGNVDPQVLVNSLIKLIIFLTFCFVVGIWFIPTMFKDTEKLMSDETLLVFSLGLCLGMVWLAVYLGFSSALGAFLMGSLLAEAPNAHKIEESLQSVKNLFSAIFFVSVGMMVNPAILSQYLVPVLCVVCVVIGGQIIFATLGVIASGHNLKTGMLCAFSLTQIGEFSFIVAESGSHYGLTSDFLYPIIVAVSVITTFTTPFFVKLALPAYNFVEAHLPKAVQNFLDRYTEKEEKSAYDSAWHDFLVNYFTRLTIYCVLIFVIQLGVIMFVLPWCQSIYGKLGEWATGLGTIVLISPILAVMLRISGKLRAQYSTLYLKNRVNRLPLFVLRVFRIVLAFFTIEIIFDHIMPLETLTSVGLSIFVCWLLYECDALVGVYFSYEADFLVNLNQMHVEQYQNENGEPLFPFDEDFKTMTLTLDDNSMLIGKSLIECQFGFYYGCNVLCIERKNGEHIDMPAGKTVFEKGDTIRVIGDSQQFIQFEAANEYGRLGLLTEESAVTLKEYMLSLDKEEHAFTTILVVVPKSYAWVGRSIRESGIKTDFNSLVIGLQRGKYTFSNPALDFIIQENDALWILGQSDICKKLVEEDLL